ncbi:hypothetical protein ABPG75_013049 [Micractinium tetrahymenae]
MSACSAALCAASNSGRLSYGHEPRSSSFCGSQLPLPPRRLQRLAAGRAGSLMVAAAAFGRNKGAYKKYMSRQDLEVAYFKEWEETTVLAEQEGRRKMTLLTMLAFLPNFIKFYLIPGPIRYVWWLIWSVVREAGYQLRKKAVVAGAKLDVATLQRRGITPAGYELRATALRRLHGKQGLLGPVLFALGGRQA